MIEVPLELLVLLGVLAVLSIFLTIIIRNDFRTSAGAFDPWDPQLAKVLRLELLAVARGPLNYLLQRRS